MFQPDMAGSAALPLSDSFPPSGNVPVSSSDKADRLLAAAHALLPVLEAGRPVDARSLREVMTEAFGAGDDTGAWLWKDAYEAAEAAWDSGPPVTRRSGTGPTS